VQLGIKDNFRKACEGLFFCGDTILIVLGETRLGEVSLFVAVTPLHGNELEFCLTLILHFECEFVPVPFGDYDQWAAAG